MALRYTSALHGGQVSYTGNIAEWQWKHQDQTDTHTYAFAYDPIARLKQAYHFTANTRDYRFEERDIDYDKNSNIRSLTTTDQTAAADSRSYTYSGNQLTNMGGGTYSYDLNGNMTRDGENNLILKYNRLNLIEKVSQNATTLANYSYLWNGTKLSATDASGNGLCYMGSLVYNKQGRSLTLESAAVPGGRIIATNNNYKPQYFLTDHLGSVRAIVNDEKAVEIQNDYYPFGGRWNEGPTSDNRYLFNGKEAQSFVNLPYLDYGARQYDPNTGRWFNIDPMAGMYFPISPYAYCAGNPIKFVDPDGNRLVATNNSYGVMYNIAKIATTNMGQKVVDRLISSKSTYMLTGTFWTTSSSYNYKSNEINYVKNPWLSSVDGGSLSSEIAMGHELMHAYQDDIGMFRYADRTTLESGAVGFENDLRDVWGENQYRTHYSGLDINVDVPNEQPTSVLSDFQNVFRSDDNQTAGFKAVIKTGKNQQNIYW